MVEGFNMTTDLLDADMRKKVHDHVYNDVAPWWEKNQGSDSVAVYPVRLSQGLQKARTYKFDTWGCHAAISHGAAGAIALFSHTRKHRMPARDELETKELMEYADYFVNRSPFAPYIFCTVEEYIKYGILIDAGIPANVMASLCISSRWIYKKDFCSSFLRLRDILGNEDDAYMATHWFTVTDKSITIGYKSDHGNFRLYSQLSPSAFYSWMTRTPAYTNHLFKVNNTNSTNWAVYDLFDVFGDNRDNVKRSVPFPQSFLTSVIKGIAASNGKNPQKIELEGLNIFQAAADWIYQEERKKKISTDSNVLNVSNTKAYQEALATFFYEVRSNAMSMDCDDFSKWMVKFVGDFSRVAEQKKAA